MHFSDAAGRACAIFAENSAATVLYTDIANAPSDAQRWLEDAGLKPTRGQCALTPLREGGNVAVFECGGDVIGEIGAAAWQLPEDRVFEIADYSDHTGAATLAWAFGGYRFARYKEQAKGPARLLWPKALTQHRRAYVQAVAAGVYFGRDLINTPANDLGPIQLAEAARSLAERFGAEYRTVVGDALIEQNFPMIHAVGRAGSQAPRLIDFTWGESDAPRVTIIGKGVCFDTGGLDIKPSSAMRLMKKDMGGAATTLAVASIIMSLNLKVRLRVLIPAVENNIAAGAFRPGDILHSRKGLTIEIGNTDAEGRLVLADALALACEDAPDLLLDFATLTGAARIALGPDIAPFFSRKQSTAEALEAASEKACDPLWRLPLYAGYDADLKSPIADLCNISRNGGMAGSITAALFLQRFVSKDIDWVHFDIYGWNPKPKPGRPEGGEATAVRSVAAFLTKRFERSTA